MTIILVKEEIWRQMHIEGRCEATQGEDSRLQDNECLGVDPSFIVTRKNQYFQHLDLGLLASRTVRQ